MSTLGVVVVNPQGQCDMQLFSGFQVGVWKLTFERAKEPLDVGILPRTAFAGRTELYFQPLAQLSVPVAQIFTALVGMQYGRHSVPAQSI
jgi:hypothetical protein